MCRPHRKIEKNAAKNRAKITFSGYWGWGINKQFWPEYSPLEYWKIIDELREKQRKNVNVNNATFMTFFENLYSKIETTKSEEEIEKFITETLNNFENLMNPTLLWRN